MGMETRQTLAPIRRRGSGREKGLAAALGMPLSVRVARKERRVEGDKLPAQPETQRSSAMSQTTSSNGNPHCGGASTQRCADPDTKKKHDDDNPQMQRLICSDERRNPINIFHAATQYRAELFQRGISTSNDSPQRSGPAHQCVVPGLEKTLNTPPHGYTHGQRGRAHSEVQLRTTRRWETNSRGRHPQPSSSPLMVQKYSKCSG